MKLARFLTILCLTTATIIAETTKPDDNDLLRRASAQLERLAPYRRSTETGTQEAATGNDAASTDKPNEESTGYRVYQVVSEDLRAELAKRMNQNEAMFELFSDPKYVAMLQDRIKRSEEKYGYGHSGYDDGYGPGYDQNKNSGSGGAISGSASILGGITSGIISGIVGASKGSSAGSSKPKPEYGKPEYGKPQYNDEKGMDVWDFKKGILNTVVQAIKAISGGVVALKGQLIKGSGFLVSTKGKIISSTGEAISSLGRHIATNAIAPSTQHSPHPGYSYDHPPSPPSGEDDTYEGPPPPSGQEYSAGDFAGHTSYGSPSDDDDQAGLLIVKPTKPGPNGLEHLELDHPPEKTHTEDSYGLPLKGPTVAASEEKPPGSILGQSSYLNLEPPPASYQHQHQLGQPDYSYSSNLAPSDHFSAPQSFEYPPVNVQQLQFSLPVKNTANSLDLTKLESAGDVYSSLTIGAGPSLETIKVSPLKHGAKFELPTFQPHVNFHSYPSYSGHVAQAPLRIPILSPMPVRYWQYHGYGHPSANFAAYRRSSLAKRRLATDLRRNATKF